MFCYKCGAQIQDDAEFCYKCGAKVTLKGATEAATEQPAAPLPQPEKKNSIFSNMKMLAIVFCFIAAGGIGKAAMSRYLNESSSAQPQRSAKVTTPAKPAAPTIKPKEATEKNVIGLTELLQDEDFEWVLFDTGDQNSLKKDFYFDKRNIVVDKSNKIIFLAYKSISLDYHDFHICILEIDYKNQKQTKIQDNYYYKIWDEKSRKLAKEDSSIGNHSKYKEFNGYALLSVYPAIKDPGNIDQPYTQTTTKLLAKLLPMLGEI